MRYAAGPGKPLRFSRGPPYNVNQVIKMRLLIVEDELDLAEAVSAHNFRKKRAFFVKGATVATKCINKSRTILKRSSGSSLLVLA